MNVDADRKLKDIIMKLINLHGSKRDIIYGFIVTHYITIGKAEQE